MKFELKHGLPFVEMLFTHRGIKRIVPNILIDTGSATTLLSAEIALEIGLEPELTDLIRTMRGVGGAEYVYEKKIDRLKLENVSIRNYTIQIGDMDYGLDINGILGTDFLLETRAVLDMVKMELTLSPN
ncbi:retropepsin-like aspartic protease [Cohnella herbarum]|uniref:Aspartyl protease n=1 Tax=Cohnella herbarum TaxID=2728023 RepID=A0A7Z2ZMD7_9BACL|nr:retropepsin-like aspartic protease [Cohnella herbarum]QJD84007.1 hypothetical protein HH215_12980 [Cohnella herbarum]